MTDRPPPTVTAVLQQIARDPAAPGHYRWAAHQALTQIRQACTLAVMWGGDENAQLRVEMFERAVHAGPDELGPERVAFGLAADELCEALGVPLKGSIKEWAGC
jgi:hypothetical protein